MTTTVVLVSPDERDTAQTAAQLGADVLLVDLGTSPDVDAPLAAARSTIALLGEHPIRLGLRIGAVHDDALDEQVRAAASLGVDLLLVGEATRARLDRVALAAVASHPRPEIWAEVPVDGPELEAMLSDGILTAIVVRDRGEDGASPQAPPTPSTRSHLGRIVDLAGDVPVLARPDPDGEFGPLQHDASLAGELGCTGWVTTDPAAIADARAELERWQQARALASELATADAIALLSGSGLFETTEIASPPIPRLRMLDGPAGIRGLDVVTSSSLAVPCGTAVAATWDPAAVQEIGAILGRQARAKGARLHLAPTINLARTPLGGRNFESLGEDPWLTSVLAAAYVRGVRSEGVGSCPKHFVANDHEDERFTVDVSVDERTLHEVYLRPFEAAVHAGAAALMAAYNSVGGTTVTHHPLLQDVVRDRWGFSGIVLSDWYGTRSTTEALVAGVDLEMPGPSLQRGDRLAAALAGGDIDEATIRRSAARIIATLDRLGAFHDLVPGEETTRDDAGERTRLTELAAGSMVLVRNETRSGRALLPLDPHSVGTIALVGPNSRTGALGGGGSANVRPIRPSHPLGAIAARFDRSEVRHATGGSISQHLGEIEAAIRGPMVLELFADPDGAADPARAADRVLPIEHGRLLWFDDPLTPGQPPTFSARVRFELAPDVSGTWTLGYRVVGDGRLLVNDDVVLDDSPIPLAAIAAMGKPEQRAELDLEAGVSYRIELQLRRTSDGDGLSGLLFGRDRPVPADPIAEAVAVAAGADVAICVVGTNGEWETEGRDRASLALPGDQDELVRRVAEVARSTVVVVNAGSAVAMPWFDDVDAVLVAWFAGEVFGEALADVVSGRTEPAGRLPLTFPRALEQSMVPTHHRIENGRLEYGEGRLVGHRWYLHEGVDPLLPFGFGLGWSRVEVTDAELVGDHVRVGLANRGAVTSSQVVQVYLEPPTDHVAPDDPPLQLVGFARATVPGGSAVSALVPLDSRHAQRWDPDRGGWVPRSGPFVLRVGTSSADLPITLETKPSSLA